MGSAGIGQIIINPNKNVLSDVFIFPRFMVKFNKTNMKPLFFIIGFMVFLSLPFYVGAVSLGETTNFYIDSSYDLNGRTQVSAILKSIGASAYFYVDSAWWSGLSTVEQMQRFEDLNNLSKEFDGNIYPTLRRVFGNEWRPGIDNDERITILIAPMPERIGGYFNPNDEYPKSQILSSNEKEMIYFNALNLSSPMAKGLLAQEFQHLISFYQKDKLQGVSEEVWLNELRSEIAVTLCGYNKDFRGSLLELRIKNFLDKPYDSLTEWKNTSNDYGVVSLLGHYLVDRYGIDVLSQSLKSPKIGIESLNIALKNLGLEKDFSQIFTDWTIASYVNDCNIGFDFCYQADGLKNFKVTPLVNFIPFIGDSTFSVINTTKDWAGNWYKFSGGHDVLKIEFFGVSGINFKVPYIVTDASGKNSLNFFLLDNLQKGKIYISDFGTKNRSLVIIPSIQQKISNFSENEQTRQFSWTASTIKESEILKESTPLDDSAKNIIITDGALVRGRGNERVYVMTGKYRRWIQGPEIFNFYGHLRWENIIEVDSEKLQDYNESSLVREENDFKVYKIENGKRHWLNMGAKDFEAKGYKWEEIFVINQRERDYFPLGMPILP